MNHAAINKHSCTGFCVGMEMFSVVLDTYLGVKSTCPPVADFFVQYSVIHLLLHVAVVHSLWDSIPLAYHNVFIHSPLDGYLNRLFPVWGHDEQHWCDMLCMSFGGHVLISL